MAELRVDNLHFTRADFQLQLEELTIQQGEKVAILGENGSGKSTLLQLLSGLLQGSGRISYDNRPLSSIPMVERARLFSLLPQSSEVIFPFTVAEVVLFGRFPHTRGTHFSEEDRQLTQQQLDKFDLLQLRDRPFNQLSGGEKRRVMLARVFNQQAPLIYLDEPNSSLDLRHTLDIFAFLKAQDETVISPVHDVNLAERFFDRFLLLKRGQLLADAKRTELTNELLTETYDVAVTRGTAAFTFQHH